MEKQNKTETTKTKKSKSTPKSDKKPSEVKVFVAYWTDFHDEPNSGVVGVFKSKDDTIKAAEEFLVEKASDFGFDINPNTIKNSRSGSIKCHGEYLVYDFDHLYILYYINEVRVRIKEKTLKL